MAKGRVRYQIFVSSTYVDLHEQRQSVIEAILQAGHIPAGMEQFATQNKTQVDVVKDSIEESDILCLMLKARSGSIEQMLGKSHAEHEYDFAVNSGKPIFFLVVDSTLIESKVNEQGPEFEQGNPGAIRDFQGQLITDFVRIVNSTESIKAAIFDAIAYLERTHKIDGWVRVQNKSTTLKSKAKKRQTAKTSTFDSDENESDRTAAAENAVVAAREKQVLRLLSAIEASTRVTWVAQRLGCSIIETKYVIQRLAARGLVTEIAVPGAEPQYSLSSSGIKFVCAAGLIGEQFARPVRRQPPTELLVALPPDAKGVVHDVSEDGSGIGLFIDRRLVPGSEVIIELPGKDRQRAFDARVIHCRPTSAGTTSAGTYFVGLQIIQVQARAQLRANIGDVIRWRDQSSPPPSEEELRSYFEKKRRD